MFILLLSPYQLRSLTRNFDFTTVSQSQEHLLSTAYEEIRVGLRKIYKSTNDNDRQGKLGNRKKRKDYEALVETIIHHSYIKEMNLSVLMLQWFAFITFFSDKSNISTKSIQLLKRVAHLQEQMLQLLSVVVPAIEQ